MAHSEEAMEVGGLSNGYGGVKEESAMDKALVKVDEIMMDKTVAHSEEAP